MKRLRVGDVFHDKHSGKGDYYTVRVKSIVEYNQIVMLTGIIIPIGI